MSRPYTTLMLVLLAANAAAADVDTIALRAETQTLERQMYEVFNKLNSNDDFDVACGETAVTGSTIPVWQARN